MTISARVNAALDSLQWIQRRHIIFLLLCSFTMYLDLFHDLHNVIVTTIATSHPTSSVTSVHPGSSNKDRTKSRPSTVKISKIPSPPPLIAEPEDEEPMKTDDGSLPPDLVPMDEYVAICLSVKEQSRDMVEFFKHHYYHMGIRRFYVMDDGSDPPLSTFNYPGVPRSILTFTYQPRESRARNMQEHFYRRCLQNYRTQHRWIAFIDADEFFDVPGNETMREVLESFENDPTVGALGWQSHTSNNFLTRQDSVRKSYTTCVSDFARAPDTGPSMNRHIKSIVKTSAGIPRIISVHKFGWKRGPRTVGEYGDEVTTIAFRVPITRDRISLHHYVVKSKQEYEEKKARGSGMSKHKKESLWNEVENGVDHVECLGMIGYDP